MNLNLIFGLVVLLAEMTALSQTGLTTGWSTEDHMAAGTDGGDLSVREKCLKIKLYN